MFQQLFSPEIRQGIFTAFHYVYLFLPIWLPIIFLILFFRAWVDYRRTRYWAGMGSLLLEMKLPKDIFKSPLAMEVVLNQLHQTADESNWYWKYWRGQTRSWFSLEIASFGGQVHFYIWTRKKYRNGIEAHLYSQYPGIEIHEVEDYTKKFEYVIGRDKMFACQWELSEVDPLPIGTYVDYGLDKDPKEEFKVDPLTSQLEFLGTLTEGQNLWIQIIVRAHKKEQLKVLPFGKMLEKFAIFEKVDTWKEEAKEEIEKIMKDLKPEGANFPRIPRKDEADKMAAIQRSVGKIGFDVSIRSMYFASKDIYDSIYLGGMLGGFKQYGSMGMNGFKSAGWHSTFSNPWKDWWKTSQDKLAQMVMDEYKLRRFFFSPFRGKWFYSKPFVLNAEELATIYHPVGASTATPTLERLPSRKSEAPANLPI